MGIRLIHSPAPVVVAREGEGRELILEKKVVR